MHQMLKKMMLLVAVVCGVTAHAGVGSVVAWPFRKIDDLQRLLLTTKTNLGRASLLALGCVFLRQYGSRIAGIQNVDGKPMTLSLEHIRNSCLEEKANIFARALIPSEQYFLDAFSDEAMPTTLLWAGIALTAWNNTRYERDAKKAAEEPKKALGVEESGVESTAQ